MFRRRNLLIGGLLAVLAGTASAGHSWVTERSAARKNAVVPVVVATKAVAARSRLDRSMLNLRPTPRRWVVAGALRSLEAAQGRYTAVPLWAGEQVLLAHLGPPDDPAALPNGLSPAERGAVVSVEAGTAKAVRPGDCVDVVAVTPSGDGLSQVSRLVPGVRVLKVSGREEAVGGLDPWVMLAVSPSQAQTLALAEETGKVRLVLRGGPDPSRPSDREGLASERRPARTPATGLAGEQRPGGTRPQVTVVEVIRGVEREAQAGPEALLRH